jgi:GNAT superfamily N-acetyltransferase
MRRPWLLLAFLGTASGLAWLWLDPSDLRLRVDPRSREVALHIPTEAVGRKTSGAVLHALAELAPPEQRVALREQLSRPAVISARRVTVSFIPGQPAELGLDTPEISEGGKIIPGLARVQLRGVPHGYLLVHADPASGLLEAASRRRWIGRALIEAGAQAETATIAVGESDDGAFLVATIAFAYRTGEEAQAALIRLTEKQGDYDALGFAARPGTDRITRRTKLLVVRLDIESDLVLKALGRR